MQNTFKVGEVSYKAGDKIRVVELAYAAPSRYQKFIGETFVVVEAGKDGVSLDDPDQIALYNFFYFNEIELVKDEPTPQEVVSPSQVSQSQEVVPTPKKSIAWAVVNKATGKVEWIRQTRRVARKLAKFQNETSTHVYQVKKIEFNFV